MADKQYFVTVEGLVSRVSKVQAADLADAMKQAKQEFMSQVGALNAIIVTANQEKS